MLKALVLFVLLIFVVETGWLVSVLLNTASDIAVIAGVSLLGIVVFVCLFVVKKLYGR